jgi:hypothetical protein
MAKANPSKEELAEVGCTYTGFGEAVLGKTFYPKQAEVLDALFPNGSFVGFASCNGGGKTREVIATAVLAHLALFQGKVIATSGSFRQVKDQLMPALKAYESRFPAWHFLESRIETGDANSFLSAFSTKDAGRFEGQHGSKDSPLLLVFDECKTIKDDIFGAGERCRIPHQWCRVLYASSPGFAQGEFYRVMTTRSGSLTHAPIRQKAEECPHITAEEIASIRAKWGPEHPLVRSMLDAEFMPFVEGAIVQLRELDALLADPPPFKDGQIKVYFDAAWSESAAGDETVAAMRRGNRITLAACFRERGLHATAGRLIGEFVRLGFSPTDACYVEGDNGGQGKLIIDQLWKMGWRVGRANSGEAPRYNDRYQNLAAEMWVEGAMAIARREFILPDDQELYGQMLDRKIVPSNRGLLAIESKQAMKDPNREGGAVTCSPDRADAVFGAMAPMPMLTARQVMGQKQPEPQRTKESLWGERDSGESDGGEGQGSVLPGAYFG